MNTKKKCICCYYIVELMQTSTGPVKMLYQDWTLLRIWDAMEFEEEQEENVSAQLRATGEFDEKASKEVL